MFRPRPLVPFVAFAFALLVALSFIEIRRWQAAAAAAIDPATSHNGSQTITFTGLEVVADTTGTMGRELNALTSEGIWDDADIVHVQNYSRTYSVITFKDMVTPVGTTDDPALFETWLNGLNALGGEPCPDASLGGLAALVGRPGNDILIGLSPDRQALLLTDAAPQGGRRHVARVMNILADANVHVTPIISGWCPGAPLSPAAMDFLALGTGGATYMELSHPISLTEDFSETLNITLHDMATPDTLAFQVGGQEELFSRTHHVSVDSTVDVLDFKVQARPITHSMAFTDGTTRLVQLTDPEGNEIMPGDNTPGVTYFETATTSYFRIELEGVSISSYRGNWTADVSGEKPYHFTSSADSGLTVQFLNSHTVPAGRPTPVRVALSVPRAVTVMIDPGAIFKLRSRDGSREIPLDLYDDGLHGDGQGADGIFGGSVVLPQGLWYLWVTGNLDDGSAFQRLDPIPIRAHPFHVQPPVDRQALPGSVLAHSFTLTNEGEEMQVYNNLAAQTYELTFTSSQGWALTDTLPTEITLETGESVDLVVPLQIPEDAEPGAIETISLTAVAPGDDLFDSATASSVTTVVDQLTVYLPATLK